ncbi:LysR substrate-binding domain-containing protein [Marinivivus vitaminiproducens]|uniref:LysR substrate-binding domain-containing protein n=1 Tax=Marinivivus vitaminiproducens TaxID=3035935 RepID=UPI00279A2F08|nr:LysR substrate-binding domain-containing protein [Geminicoccaceae bacterium SCSIO 64248]
MAAVGASRCGMSLSGLSLRDLEYLVAVSECRHFGRAAAHCAVSQPSLSAQIRKLEAYLGVTVFERAPGRVEITVQGKAILARAESVLREARALIDTARASMDPLSGPLRLGAIPTLGPYLLPFALGAIRRAFPGVSLILSEGRTEELMASLRGGVLDVVLACMPERDDGFVVHRLFLEPFFLVHRAGRVPDWPLHDAAEPIVLLDEGHCLRDHARNVCDPRTCVAACYASGLEMLRQMVAAGEGLSFMPALAARALGTQGGLVAYTPLDDTSIGRDVVLVARRSDPRADHIPTLGRLINDHCPGRPLRLNA